MAIVNEYKGRYPSEVNNFETDSFYVNATSMEKAVSMLTLEHGKEPTICTKIRDNVLTEITNETTVNIEVKSYYSQFVDPNTGEYKDWFFGANSLVDQANRQIIASDGMPICWYFAEESAMNATQALFDAYSINGIDFKYVPLN